jgi:hypothetical protein
MMMPYLPSRMRSMRRSGSAAPHSNWSPITKAEMYSGPMFSLRTRPTPISSLPVIDGRSQFLHEISRSFGTHFTHGLPDLMMASISLSGRSFFSFTVRARLWQRMAPIRTHRPSTGMVLAGAEDLVDFGLALPLFLGLAVVELLVDPGDQAARQRRAEELGRHVFANALGHLAVDVENGGGRGCQLIGFTAEC